METVWFALVASMLAMYVVFDGFDIGVGAVHLLVAKSRDERRAVIRSIGPVWDGNEVWLLAAGGTLYLAFPGLYASSFSGFYLPLMIVLWLLILRGISIEFRNHLKNEVWISLWDVVFGLSSLALAIFFGAALGNVVRGVPLDEAGWFFCPLWTDFRVGANPGILDWYTVTVGLTALAALALHGALWVRLKTTGAVEFRAARVATRTWWATLALTLLTTGLTFWVQPHVLDRLSANVWGLIFPALALLGLTSAYWLSRRGDALRAFLASSTFLLGMMASAAFGLYPLVLPDSRGHGAGLTVHEVAAAPYSLRVALVWWIPGMILVAAYFTYTYRSFAGKVDMAEYENSPH